MDDNAQHSLSSHPSATAFGVSPCPSSSSWRSVRCSRSRCILCGRLKDRTRIRGVDRTLATIRNATLAKMPIVNFTRRDGVLLNTVIGVRYETTSAQLRQLLVQLEDLLHSHPRVAAETARARFIGFGDSSLNIELLAHVMTSDWVEFTVVREDLMLRVMTSLNNAALRSLARRRRCTSAATVAPASTGRATPTRRCRSGIARAPCPCWLPAPAGRLTRDSAVGVRSREGLGIILGRCTQAGLGIDLAAMRSGRTRAIRSVSQYSSYRAIFPSLKWITNA